MSVKQPRRIFIGDVHGHYDGLMHLLDAIAPGTSDRVYFLGDLIDRGPQSSNVVNFVQNSSYQCIRGNHEQLLIDAFPDGKLHSPALQAWLYSGGQSTVSSYQDMRELMEHVYWAQSLPTYLDLGDVWLVHAGVHPGLPIDEQTPEELCWIRDLFHGMEQPYFADKLIITGHTITFTLPGVEPGKIARGRGWMDIDTGAYHRKSGWLTALDLTHELVYQVNVFEGGCRVMSLADATMEVDPRKVSDRHQLLSR
ncbi:serine/threonine protein phosphatase [Desertifilum sp. FACHB-1129]|uniref:Serine/threonine protein phosphatase n=2 Tax=Desertifilum tharense IPPAS B-1220 TaxID=1781255 RepID=A0A1E5QSE8_9CYAN|nr:MULTISPECIES: metallophosphoesterase family protein [Desertifilum]MCD8488057.1 serine/threonine protein phosphatase [Desertifilum sp.]MDA0213703.1 metallophosphoesterase family protein [Cyanobacteria bacterium FC1]MBD2311919.1 serine/threonine protein phosphatase [Desertifilum sp. FACHB-1129]MBD2324566.1 serine/threonine protein phosphatase [Desertifilum sp. FACHB-866]MBD2334657.1 serine/threonine protein phosphatase [Desertifilum sp. FACHB-868]